MAKFKANKHVGNCQSVDFICALNLDYDWIITVEKEKKLRSPSQNSLYWRWVTIIGDELGNFKDDMHEILKEDHLPPKIIIVQGKERCVYSIKNLTKKEMSDYMDKVNLWAGSEMGIFLPSPVDLQRNS